MRSPVILFLRRDSSGAKGSNIMLTLSDFLSGGALLFVIYGLIRLAALAGAVGGL